MQYILSQLISKIPFRRYFRVFRLTHNITHHKTRAVVHITYLRTKLPLHCSNGLQPVAIKPVANYIFCMATMSHKCITNSTLLLLKSCIRIWQIFLLLRQTIPNQVAQLLRHLQLRHHLGILLGYGEDSHRTVRSHRLTSYVVQVDDSTSVINCEGISVLRKQVSRKHGRWKRELHTAANFGTKYSYQLEDRYVLWRHKFSNSYSLNKCLKTIWTILEHFLHDGQDY